MEEVSGEEEVWRRCLVRRRCLVEEEVQRRCLVEEEVPVRRRCLVRGGAEEVTGEE